MLEQEDTFLVASDYLLLLLFFAHQHKAAGIKLSKMLNNSCKSFLFGVHGVDWTASPPQQGYGQVLKQKDFLWCHW